MNKLKTILVVILSVFLVLPFGVLASQETSTDPANNNTPAVEVEKDKKVKVYFFRGEGCPHCEDAETFFKSIQEPYGDLYTIVDYETWYNTENADLLQKVGEARGEDIQGVPYIIVGNKSWSGFSNEYDDEIVKTIKSEYEKDPEERYDIIELVNTGKTNGMEEETKSYANDAMILVAILIVVAGIVTGIVVARKKTK